MPLFLKRAATGGRATVTVDHHGEKITLELHAEGPRVAQAEALMLRLQGLQVAAKRVTALERRLNGGTISADEFDEQARCLDDARAQEKITAEQYRISSELLKAARDGEPVSPDEFRQLSQEIEEWQRIANLDGMLDEYLLASIAGWDIYETEDAMRTGAEPLPVTRETLAAPVFTRELKLSMLERIRAHYTLADTEGKESSESLQNGSQTKSTQPEKSQISTPSISSQENMANGHAM